MDGSQTDRLISKYRRQISTATSSRKPYSARRKIGGVDEADLYHRTFSLMKVAPLQTINRPARYFDEKTRKAVDDNNYWSSPTPHVDRGKAKTDRARFNRNKTRENSMDSNGFEKRGRSSRSANRPSTTPSETRFDRRMMRTPVPEESEAPKVKQPIDSWDDFGAADVLAHLDSQKLAKLKKEFKNVQGDLSVEQFVDCMLKFLPKDIDEVKLTSALCQFFTDVDVNGDGTMSWDEFTNFIIDRGMHLGDLHYEMSVEKYQRSAVVDKIKHDNRIDRVLYFAELDHLIILEKDVNYFKVARGKDCTPLACVKGHQADVLGAEYISSTGWVATCANDRSIRFWDPHTYAPINFVIQTAHTELAMRWHQTANLLFTSNMKNQISALKFKKQPHTVGKSPYTSSVIATYNGHDDVVLDMKILPSMGRSGSLVTASLDTTIALWDINTTKRIHELKGHEKGVFSLAYHSDYHILVSAAFEHSAIVWNPYVASKICKLKGHYNPLIGVEAVPNSPQILTADLGGIIKIWDIRNFGCIQTIYVEDNRGVRVTDLSDFTCIHSHKRLVSASTRLYFHDSLTSSSHHNPTIADMMPSRMVLYNSHSATFISASGATVKIWNEKDGTLSHVYRTVSENEITAVALDDLQRKFVIGDTNGNIKVFNYLNGAPLDAVNIGKKEITSVHVLPGLQHVLATASDGGIYIYDIGDRRGFSLVKKLNHHRAEISAVGLSKNLSLIATCDGDGSIAVWDYFTHQLTSDLIGHKTSITAFTFLDPYPVCASADNEGNICFWVIRPLLLNMGKCILRLVNMSTEKRAHGKKEPVPVTAMAFWMLQDSARLFTADCTGFIKIWDLAPAFHRWGLTPFRESSPMLAASSTMDAKELLAMNDPEMKAEAMRMIQGSHKAPTSRFGDYTKYRKEHMRAQESLENQHKGKGVLLKKGDVKLLKWWRAHGDSVRDLRMIWDKPGTGIVGVFKDQEETNKPKAPSEPQYPLAEPTPKATTGRGHKSKRVALEHCMGPDSASPLGLVSCSYDKQISLWDISGAMLGRLEQGRRSDSDSWDFSSNAERRRRRSKEHAVVVLELLHKRRTARQHAHEHGMRERIKRNSVRIEEMSNRHRPKHRAPPDEPDTAPEFFITATSD